MLGTVINWWMHAQTENTKIKMSFETLSQKAKCLKSGYAGYKDVVSQGQVYPSTLCLWCCPGRCNHISSHPAGSLCTSNRDARGSLWGRTRKKEQVCFPSLWALPHPRPFTQAVTVSFDGFPWFQVAVCAALPEPVSESPACARWSLLRGLIPPLSLKLWQFQPLLFASPACD